MKNKKILFIIILTILLSILTIYLISIRYFKLLPVTITLLITIIIYMYIIFQNKNIKEIYEKKLNNILNTYESIIIKTNKKYNLKSSKVLYITSLDNLIKAQRIINKPINYLQENEKNIFILQDLEYLLVYILQ